MSVGDQLLYTITARGRMSYLSVKRAFDCLYEFSDEMHNDESWKFRRNKAIRTFEALGHIEIDAPPQGITTVAVTPPAIVVLPERGLPHGVLVGSRLPKDIERLLAAARRAGLGCAVSSQPSAPHLYPTRISLVADNCNDLAAFAKAQGLDYGEIPSAWAILHLAGSLDDFWESFMPENLISLNWDREDFDPKLRSFRKVLQKAAVVLSKFIDPVRGIPRYVLSQAGRTAFVEPAWGRLAVLHAITCDVLIYDTHAGALAVPISVPLPKLLGRALCLCSGFVPIEMDGIEFPNFRATGKVYQRVPLRIAEGVAAKLQQRLVFRPFFFKAGLREGTI